MTIETTVHRGAHDETEHRLEVEVTFDSAPYGRGPEVTIDYATDMTTGQPFILTAEEMDRVCELAVEQLKYA